MADIFLSYAREDVGIARQLAQALETEGWVVFWDRRIPPGRRWSEYLEEQLNAAKCLITLWSKSSVSSDWVLEEAEVGKERGILVPALIEPGTVLPMGFRRIHAADLLGWSGNTDYDGFGELLAAVRHLVPPPTLAPEAEQETPDAPSEGEIGEPAEPSFDEMTMSFPVPSIEPGIVAAKERSTTYSAPADMSPAALQPLPDSTGVLVHHWRGRRTLITVAAIPCLAFAGWLGFSLLPKSDPVDPEQPAVTSQSNPDWNPGELRRLDKDQLTYVWIPPGEFVMGCSEGDTECYDHEKPPHREELTRGFWITQTEVTQAAFERVMRETGVKNPSQFRGDDNLPVDSVTWFEARDYCNAIGGKLPTEAQWEYAARAKTRTARYGDLNRIAWFGHNSGNRTRTVESKDSNSWGLYDTLGNVWEWVSDSYDDDFYKSRPNPDIDPENPHTSEFRVLRGASWTLNPWDVRVSFRGRSDPEDRINDVGFRCTREAFP